MSDRPYRTALKHGILQPLEDYRAMEGTRALNRQLVGFPLVMMLVGVVVLGFAVVFS